MTPPVALVALIATTCTGAESSPRLCVVLSSKPLTDANLKKIWTAKDAKKEALGLGLRFVLKGDFGYFIEENLTLDDKIQNTRAILDSVLSSSAAGKPGVVDGSILPKSQQSDLAMALRDYKSFLPRGLQSKVASGQLKFTVEPSIYTKVTAGDKSFQVAGSLGSAAEWDGIMNEEVTEGVNLPESSLVGTTVPGGTFTWVFSPGFRRQSNRLRAMREGAELLWKASEGSLNALEESWGKAVELLSQRYADRIGQLTKDGDSYSKLDPLAKQHLMLTFSRSFAENGFSNRLEAESWLQGASLKDSKMVLFIAVGVKDSNGQRSRVSFPLIHP